MDQKAMVSVISGWKSKINWTQAGVSATTLITALGIDIPADKKVAVLTAVTLLSNMLTWVLRTWYTDSVIGASVDSK